ncbi:MAG: outer membrane protein assembly factor BamD [Candidatus Marinimicrobia bacterium]|nr:outer membrane protein assembly factor BamD [Candidatus Neomarinimicrobiota bacterium]
MKKHLGIIVLISALVFSCSDNRTAEALFQDAAELYKQEKITRSLKTFEKLSNTYPDDPYAVKAIYRMAEIYAGDLQDFEACVSKYMYVANEYPSHPDAPKARFMSGYTLANIIKDYKRAEAEYNKFIRDYPEHPLVESVQFELRNLGKELDQIEELKDIMKTGKNE